MFKQVGHAVSSQFQCFPTGVVMPGVRSLVATLSLAAAAAWVPPAFAATVYFGEDLGAGNAANMPNSLATQAQFLADLAAYGTENFEGLAAGTEFFENPTASLDFAGSGVTASLTGGLVRNAPFGARFAADGTNYLDTAFNQRIEFSTPVAAFGLFVIDANEVDNDPATVTINGQTLTQAQIEARPFDSVDGIFRIVTLRSPGVFEVLFDGGTFPARNSSAMFVGLVDEANPFTNIRLINGASGLDFDFLDGFGYDRMTVALPDQMAPIPEPSTWALMALGLAGVAGMARRRRA